MSNKKSIPRIFHALFVAVSLLTLTFSTLGVTSAQAATLTVTNTADSGAGSLRQAIVNAGIGDIITFDPSLSGGTIRLASVLTLSKDVTIDGSTLGLPITISGDTTGDGTGDVRVFYVNSGVIANLKNLTISMGRIAGEGGGISNSGILTVINCVFSYNYAVSYTCGSYTCSGAGGGISNYSTLTVTNSTFSNNSAYGGAGVSNKGTMIVLNSAFSNNSGGGIGNTGTLTVGNTYFTGNTGNGGIDNFNGTLTISDSTFSTNSASTGGGISNTGTGTTAVQVTVTNSTFSANNGSSKGGGIEFSGINITGTITGSTFSANDASNGSGIYANIQNSGSLTVTNSTFVANGHGVGYGGGVYIDSNRPTTVRNSTFSANSAYQGNGIYINAGTLNYANNILANSPTGKDCYNYNGSIGSNTHNLVETNVGCGTPYLTTDPNLAALADNGGLTHTMALPSGSPAIDAGDNASCTVTDQRGMVRPQDGDGNSTAVCDIGSYESSVINTPPTISDITDKNTSENTATGVIAFTVGDADTPITSLNVTTTSSNTTLVPNGNVTLGGSGTNRTINVAPASNQNGTTTITVTVNDGTTTVSDTFVLTVNAAYDLTYTAGAGGSITSPAASPTTHDYGTVVTITAVPATGYHFVNWTGDVGTVASTTAASTTITMNGDYNITANFAIDTHTLAYTAGTGGAVTSPAASPTAHDYGTVVTITAVPATGYHFVNWTGNVGTVASTTAASTTITMNGDYSITANFAIDTHTLTYTAGAGGSITAPPTSPTTYNYGTVVTITAVPATGYHFVNWTGDVGTVASTTAASTTITMNGDYSITANFAIDTHTLAYTAGTGGAVTSPAASPTTHDYGTVVTITAVPATGYHFVNWTGDVGSVASTTAASTTITMNGDYNITANFAITPPAPIILSIALAGINPIDGAGLDFTVTFDKPVTGVDKDDFSLTKAGSIMGASITGVSPVSQSVYTVTVNSGSGNGSLRLDLPATATIQDLSANAFVGPYSGGETYTPIKGPAPTVPVLKLPKNKALLTTSTPTLDWGDSSQVMALATGWHYEIQVTAPYGAYNETFNTAASADPTVGLGASTFTIPAEKPLPASTTFTWRVRAFDAAYRYSAWSKEFTFNTGKLVTPVTEGAPTVPTLKLPKNKSLVVGYTLVLLDWNDSALPVTAPAGCLYYEVRVTSPYRNYNAAFATAPGAPSEYTIPAENILPADSIFTWQVRSACNDGATTKYSAWSKEFTFRTKLATPTLLSPIDDAVTPLDNIRPTFTWEPVSGAATYTLQVLNQDGKVVVTGTVKAPLYTFTPKKDLLPNAAYTWKVKANGKNPGDYSAPFTFVTGASAPAIPTPSAPKNNALVESAAEQTLVWNLVDNTTLAVSYQVEYATNAAFLESTVLPAADKQLVLPGGTLLPGRTYYWRVRSLSAAGNHSAWSKALAIKVKFVVPTLTTPTAGAAVGITPTFTWDSANGLWTNYTLQIATDAEFKSGLKSFTIKAPVTTFTLPAKSALIPGDYFWRVKINGVYTPITSEAQSFTVAP